MLDEPIEPKSKLTEGLRLQPAKKALLPLLKNRSFLMGAGAGLVVGIVAIGLGIHFHDQAKIKSLEQKVTQLKSDPSADAKAKIQELVDQVGKLIILPADEQPTVATVTDLSKLKDQPFFAHAQLGDKVLIYSKAQKAILFRPSENKIIELAPLTTATGGQNQPANVGQ